MSITKKIINEIKSEVQTRAKLEAHHFNKRAVERNGGSIALARSTQNYIEIVMQRMQGASNV